MCVSSAILPLSRRYQTDLLSLGLCQINMQCFTDTLFEGVKSLNNNTCSQLFIDRKYIYTCPMKRKREAGDVLKNFTEYVSIPNFIISYIASEQTGHNTEFMTLINKYCIGDRTAEMYYTWKNLAQNLI